MKITKLILVLLLALLLAACGNEAGNTDDNGNPAAEADVPANFVQYSNSVTGVTLHYPPEWQVLDESGSTVTLGSHPELALGQEPDEPYGLYLVSVEGRASAGLPDNPPAGDLVTLLQTRFDSFGLTEESITAPPEASNVNDNPAAIGTVVVDDGAGREVANTFLIFVADDRLVTVISATPAEALGDFAETFGAINRSIHVETPDLALVEGVDVETNLERGHDPNVVYEDNRLPPLGGLHDPIWQNCGIYDEPVGDKNAVHSLEHGAVWVTYRPDLDSDAVEYLRSLARGEDYVLLSPYPDLRSPVVLTAWGVQLELDDVFDERVEAFIDTYQEGPQTPEPGATCQSGLGTPIE